MGLWVVAIISGAWWGLWGGGQLAGEKGIMKDGSEDSSVQALVILPHLILFCSQEELIFIRTDYILLCRFCSCWMTYLQVKEVQSVLNLKHPILSAKNCISSVNWITFLVFGEVSQAQNGCFGVWNSCFKVQGSEQLFHNWSIFSPLLWGWKFS